MRANTAAWLVFCCCIAVISCAAGALGGYYAAGRWPAPALDAVLRADDVPPPAPPAPLPGRLPAKGGKRPEEWKYQDIQDRLRAKGIPNARTLTRRGDMLFILGRDSPITFAERAGTLSILEELGVGEGQVLVKDESSAEFAQRYAEDYVDRQQQPAFAWGRFVFRGHPDSLDRVRKALP